jgi:hypothetical protein
LNTGKWIKVESNYVWFFFRVETHELKFGSHISASGDAMGAIDKETILGGAAVLSGGEAGFF